jgi:nicotinamide phosphoribosyltransferase
MPVAVPGALPMGVLTDSYKASHFAQYPAATKMVAYGEFRSGYERDAADARFAWYGIRYVIENYVARRWTMEDVDRAGAFYGTHLGPGFGAYPYPRELFRRIVTEHDGYFPVRIQALPEGTAAHARVPVYQVRFETLALALCLLLSALLGAGRKHYAL